MFVAMSDIPPLSVDSLVAALSPMIHDAVTSQMSEVTKRLEEHVNSAICKTVSTEVSEMTSRALEKMLGCMTDRFNAFDNRFDAQHPEFRRTGETLERLPSYIKIVLKGEADKLMFKDPKSKITDVDMRAELQKISGTHWKQVSRVKFFDVREDYNGSPYLLLTVETGEAQQEIRKHWVQMSKALGLSSHSYLEPPRYTLEVLRFAENPHIKSLGDLKKVAQGLELELNVKARVTHGRLLLDYIDVDKARAQLAEPITLVGLKFYCE